ncbi:MAG: Fe3+/spermidine/putrescine ABC transporter ATP-binding protein [Alphaproteobacteria bacterium]|jgi:iron(III) transport system ATP-binding protein|nr:Fe3+/spermidine/putrescine ABC transporter ATP-binding protein [Alphaproteobacteria bacterium]PPR14267.1 MAG: Spermidine/putrescine import ATP-binding protein PotA [Alphaproteobacteria bacterium MarineAlpha12_Bin1]|tara:strand:- start:12195 stop:13319 length:1125 start_codon:yes stop_codon:yes gene_type:complete
MTSNNNSDATVRIKGLDKHFGPETAVLDFNILIEQGEFVTLLGPSGCGKTTTLRCVAGLERPDGGDIFIGDQLVASYEQDVYLNPEDRNIGMVFQSYAVWPHMTVFDNVAYGLRVRRASKSEIKKKTMRALELVGLDHLADRYATKLSGGQRQRVALARAIVYEPRVILFDEPLSNLDAKLREQMRDEIVRLQKEVGITSIFVTHDQSEALVMSDRVVVMDKAVIQQVGDPQDIYANPANAFVANFIGVTSLLKGNVKGHSNSIYDIELPSIIGGEPLRLRATGEANIKEDSEVHISLRPEDVILHIEKPSNTENLNLLEGKVIDTVYLGSFLECRVNVKGHEINIQIDHFENLSPDQTVFLTFNPEHALCLAN